MSQNQAFRGLRLPTFYLRRGRSYERLANQQMYSSRKKTALTWMTYRIDNEQHHVDNLSTANDSSNQTGVPWTIDQGNLKFFLVGKMFPQVLRQIEKEATKTEIERHPSLSGFFTFVQSSCR